MIEYLKRMSSSLPESRTEVAIVFESLRFVESLVIRADEDKKVGQLEVPFSKSVDHSFCLLFYHSFCKSTIQSDSQPIILSTIHSVIQQIIRSVIQTTSRSLYIESVIYRILPVIYSDSHSAIQSNNHSVNQPSTQLIISSTQ